MLIISFCYLGNNTHMHKFIQRKQTITMVNVQQHNKCKITYKQAITKMQQCIYLLFTEVFKVINTGSEHKEWI